VNVKTYTLSSDTLASTDGIDVFDTGRTNLVITLSGIHQSTYHYTKFVIDFGDGSEKQTIQNTTDIKLLSGESISHIFNPTNDYITTYNIVASGYRTDGILDLYPLNLKLSKGSITDYKSIKIIDTQLYTTPAGVNNVILTVEAQDPKFVGNIILPYDIDSVVYTDQVLLPELNLTDLYLRTEIYTGVGGEVPIISEHDGAHIIREQDLIVAIIANESDTLWSGKLLTPGVSGVAICGEAASSHTITDINGKVITPTLILVPEVSFNEALSATYRDHLAYTADPSDQNLPYIAHNDIYK
jgi:hypothetical protein